MLRRQYFTLDVFTNSKLRGNPLAVVVDCEGLSDIDMQKIASEFNLPETVFVLPPNHSSNQASLRIFTPKRELPFAGHPTIGTAILLGSLNSENDRFEGELVLEEKAGDVPVQIKYHAQVGEAEFIVPGLPGGVEIVSDTKLAAQAISLRYDDIGFANHVPCFVEAAGNKWLFIPVKTKSVLAEANVDMNHWADAKENNAIVGCYVYTHECENSDASYRARMFAPDAGIVEDPATGSAAATFPGCIAEFEKLTDDKYDWLVEQGYEMGRPSQIYVSADIENTKISEVRVGGQAVLFMAGYFEI